jgi:hypothetical protein
MKTDGDLFTVEQTHRHDTGTIQSKPELTVQAPSRTHADEGEPHVVDGLWKASIRALPRAKQHVRITISGGDRATDGVSILQGKDHRHAGKGRHRSDLVALPHM